jgi:hypothetical protein
MTHPGSKARVIDVNTFETRSPRVWAGVDDDAARHTVGAIEQRVDADAD